MEILHLTYKEVFEEIPYSILLMMQKDKLHETTGDTVKKMKGRDLFADRMK